MSALYLASITLPLHTNDGESLEAVHASLQRTLADTFNGWTRLSATGGWMHKGTAYVKPVAIYQIATTRDEFSVARLLEIADTFGRMAGQLAMFVTLPNNEVRVLELVQ